MEANVRQGRETTPKKNDRIPKVGELVEAFLVQKDFEGRAESTLDLYRSVAANHVVPSVGRFRVTELSRLDIETWQMQVGGKSLTKQARQVLRGALQRAVPEFISTNPVDLVPGPGEAKARDRWLTEHEVDRLATEAGEYEPLIRFLAESGLRISEAIALNHEDVDLDARQLRVWYQWKGGERSEMKTNESRRTIGLTAVAVEALVEVVDPAKVREPLFTSPTGKRLNKRNFNRRQFKAAVEAAGLHDFHVHDLRRTCGSWLAQVGVPLNQIKEHLGHSSVRVTEKAYAHLVPGSLSAVDALSAARRFREAADIGV